MTEQLLERLSRHAQADRVGVHVATLPVEGEEALVDLLEQGAQSQIAVIEVSSGLQIGDAAFERDRLARRDGRFDHTHLKTAVDAQLHLVAEAGDEKEATAVIAQRIGQRLAIEGGGVEAPAVVLDLGDQIAICEAQ